MLKQRHHHGHHTYAQQKHQSKPLWEQIQKQKPLNLLSCNKPLLHRWQHPLCYIQQQHLLVVGVIDAQGSCKVQPLLRLLVVRLPQAWRIALPSLGNLWQSLLKDTSLVSVVGLEDLLKKAQMGAQFTQQPFVFYLAVAAAYLALLALSHPVQATLERWAQRGYAPHLPGGTA